MHWQKYIRMDASKGKIDLYFDNAPNGFMVKGDGVPTEFLIAGSDQTFLPAEVKFEKDKIVVSNKLLQPSSQPSNIQIKYC